jgi:hypothetical protein
MNIDEVVETEVFEVGGTDGSENGRGDIERMSTQDYLETLLKKNNIPRTSIP